MSKETIDALKLFIAAYSHIAPDDCFATGPKTGNLVQDLIVCPGCAAQNAAHEAIAREEAQTVEPVAWMKPGEQSRQEDFVFASNYPNGTNECNIPLYSHPAPSTKTSVELGALIEALRNVISDWPEDNEAATKAADLLAADAQWEKLRDPDILHANLLRGLPAQLSKDQLLHLLGTDAPPQRQPAGYITVESAIEQLVESLCQSKGWTHAYANALVRDAVDRVPAIKSDLTDEEIQLAILGISTYDGSYEIAIGRAVLAAKKEKS